MATPVCLQVFDDPTRLLRYGRRVLPRLCGVLTTRRFKLPSRSLLLVGQACNEANRDLSLSLSLALSLSLSLSLPLSLSTVPTPLLPPTLEEGR